MKIAPLALATAMAATLGFAPASFAQSSDRSDRDDRRSEYRSDRSERDDDGERRRDRDRAEERRGGDRDEGRRGYHRGPHHGMGPHYMGRMHGARGAGARFRIANGDARIDIRCPAHVEIQSCVQAAGELFDRMGKRAEGAQPAPGTSGSGGPLETAPDTPAPTNRM